MTDRDLPTVLREYAANATLGAINAPRGVCEMAASEIDRLTRELAEARGQVTFQDGCIKACHEVLADARAEADRLRSYHEVWQRTKTIWEAENERLRTALNAAAYALFEIKRLQPDKAHAARAHAKACAVLDGDVEQSAATERNPMVLHQMR